MDKKTTLVVMAAGMGSRFGGLKQAAPVGPNGEMILDYTVKDAKDAGFSKVVLIIRKDIEKDFKEAIGNRIEKMIDTEYVYQEIDALPEGYTAPADRQKPWGTGHAILCAKDAVNTPFAVVNADDYYGKSVFVSMHEFLKQNDMMCMMGYRLGNTLSKNGTVSRGICEIENGYLKKVTEQGDIPWDTSIPKDTVVSMNLWGLTPEIFDVLKRDFDGFLSLNINVPKKEFFLPAVIDNQINSYNKEVKVLVTDEKWYGITYKEDVPEIREALKNIR